MALKLRRTSASRVRLLSTLIAVFALLAQPMYGFVASQVANAAAGTFYHVTINGSDGNNCSELSPCRTIQAAISKAAAGDTVKVGVGLYNESIVVNKAIAIKGAQAGIDARTRSVGGVGESIINSGTLTAVKIEASGVTIDGLQIMQTGNGGNTVQTSTNYADITLENNIITTTTGTGSAMHLHGGQNFMIRHNYFSGIAGNGIVLRNGNLVAPVAANQKIIDNKFENVRAMTGGAIVVYGQSDLEIARNAIDTDFQGISIGATGPAHYKMNGVHVRDNAITLSLDGSQPNVYIYGVLVEGMGDGVVVRNNTVEQKGVTPTAATRYSLVRVSYDDSSVAVANPNGLIISENNLLSNVSDRSIVVGKNVTNQIDASKNWWGTDVNSSAKILSPTATVLSSPWLCQPYQSGNRASINSSCIPPAVTPVITSVTPSATSSIRGMQRIAVNVQNVSDVRTGNLQLNKVVTEGQSPSNANRKVYTLQKDEDGWFAMVDTTILTDGKYLFKVEAHGFNNVPHGYYGNKSAWQHPSYYFTVDNAAPKITRWIVGGKNYANPYTLADGQAFKSKNINVQFHDNTKLSKVVINGHEIVGKWSNSKSFDAQWYMNQYAEENDDNIIVLYDDAGNTTTYTFIIDTILPEISIQDVDPINPKTATIVASDAHLNRIDVSLWKEGQDNWVKFPGEWVTPVGSNYSVDYAGESKLNLAELGDGKYEIRATASDTADNAKNALSVSFVVDRTPPEIVSTGYSAANKTLTVVTNDDADKVVLTVGSTDVALKSRNGNTWVFDVASFSEPGATYKYTATATDVADNTSTTDTANAVTNAITRRSFTIADPFIGGPSVPLIDPNTPGFGPVANPAVRSFFAVPSNVVPVAEDAETDVLGARDAKTASPEKTVAVIEPSAQGWKLFGFAWFWWVLLGAAIAAGWWMIAAARRRRDDAAY